MKYVTKSAAEYLNKLLSLAATGDEQDWEIQLADPARVEELISRYREIEEDDELAFGLVSLIVASFDDRISGRLKNIGSEYLELMEGCNFEEKRMYTKDELILWSEILFILNSNMNLFKEIVKYWTAYGEDDTVFASSLFYRNLDIN